MGSVAFQAAPRMRGKCASAKHPQALPAWSADWKTRTRHWARARARARQWASLRLCLGQVTNLSYVASRLSPPSRRAWEATGKEGSMPPLRGWSAGWETRAPYWANDPARSSIWSVAFQAARAWGANEGGEVMAGLWSAASSAWTLPVAPHLVEDPAVGADDADLHGHLAEGMGRTAQARIEVADAVLDAVQDPFRNLRSGDILLGDLVD